MKFMMIIGGTANIPERFWTVGITANVDSIKKYSENKTLMREATKTEIKRYKELLNGTSKPPYYFGNVSDKFFINRGN